MTHHAFDATGPLTLDVHVTGGRLVVNATDTDVAVVTVSPHDARSDQDRQAAEQTTVRLDGSVLTVQTPRRRGIRAWLGSGPATTVVIDVPDGSSLTFRGWADLATTGRLGDVDASSTMGDVRIEHAAAARVSSAVGDVRVQRADADLDLRTQAGQAGCGLTLGRARLRTSAGDVELGEAHGVTELKTAAGSIRVGTSTAELSARTASGDVRVERAESGVLRLRTHHGQVDVGVPHGTAAWLDVDTRAGVLHSELASAEAPQDDDRTVEVHVHNLSGDVHVRRHDPKETR